jgi:beta-N-acetylhexosaminidase
VTLIDRNTAKGLHIMPHFFQRRLIFPFLSKRVALCLLLLSLAGCVTFRPEHAIDRELRQMAGQMVMVGFRGLAADEWPQAEEQIRGTGIGGVILFDYDVPSGTAVRNVSSPEQVRRLVGDLQLLAPTPLLVAIDQEGGRVNRLKERFGFPPTLSAASLGRVNDTILTARQALQTAELLASLGITMNFAPVVDVNSNRDNPIIGKIERSFSPDPQEVALHAAAVVRAHRQSGVLTALKHFPGHGSSTADSHKGFVDVTGTWSDSELLPYRKLISEGLADAVMTAHIVNDRLDPGRPATLSRPILQGVLRDRLGFEGVIVSDDLQMGAIREHYGFEEAVAMALDAGVDLLVFGNNSVYDPEIGSRAVEVIVRLVSAGTIPRERIEASWSRIMKLKKEVVSE